MAGRDALEGVGDEIACAPLRLRLRFLLELADAPCELVPNQLLGTFQELLLRLADRHAGDALELDGLVRSRLLQLVLELARVQLPVRDPLLPAGELGELALDLALLR